MDRRRAFAALLIGLTAAAPALPVREAAWLAPEMRLEALTTQPAECFDPPRGEEISVAIGRTAFRDPLLLGGQAARAGLSCASCHRNGRGNPQFLFPGLSGAPGTADVTASLMSSHRGDGTFNPKPIPDLVFDPPKIARDPARPELRDFIRGLIVEEFDGAEPTPATLDGLAVYVRSMDRNMCTSDTPEPLRVEVVLVDYVGAIGAAELALRTNDRETALAMLRAARSVLRSIDERYALPGLEQERALVRAEDAKVGGFLAALRGGQPTDAAFAAISARVEDIQALTEPLMAAQERSLYNPDVLARAF